MTMTDNCTVLITDPRELYWVYDTRQNYDGWTATLQKNKTVKIMDTGGNVVVVPLDDLKSLVRSIVTHERIK